MTYRSKIALPGLILALGSLGVVTHAGSEHPSSEQAGVPDEDLAERVKKLEESMPSWLAHWVFKGDFRFRYEMIDEDGENQRHRNRIRARIFAGIEVNDEIDVGVQLATTTGNPVSTNLTLGRSFDGDGIRLDLGYVDWHPSWANQGNTGVKFIGGKMKTPFAVMQKSELLWDPDLRPEGVAVQLTHDTDGIDLFANLGGFWVRESSGADSGLYGAQVGAAIPVGDGSFTFGAGYYDYGGVEGAMAFYLDDDGQGNSTTTAGGDEFYDEDFNELEVFGEYAFEAGVPIWVFANAVQNTAADDDDTGWVVGTKVNKASAPGSWDARYQYKRIEKDAVLAAFTDSDFGGGGTDAEGHELNFGYVFTKGWSFGATLFLNDTNISGTEDDYTRVQLDLKYRS